MISFNKEYPSTVHFVLKMVGLAILSWYARRFAFMACASSAVPLTIERRPGADVVTWSYNADSLFVPAQRH